MKIIYEKDLEGRAINLRFEKDDYQLKEGEIEYGKGDELPDIETLHSEKYRLKKQKEDELENIRRVYSTTLLDTLINTLISKGILSLDDFPQDVKDMILKKQRLEQELKNL